MTSTHAATADDASGSVVSHAALELQVRATTWLDGFERAVNGLDGSAFGQLFRSDGSWRDLLALTGSLRTADGRAQVVDLLGAALGRPEPHRLSVVGTSIQVVPGAVRFGLELTEVFFDFTTDIGEGKGIVRLLPAEDTSGAFSALTLLTSLQSLEASTGRGVSIAASVGVDQRNWAERRTIEVDYADREPSVLVIGAGQAGLSAAAALKAVGVDTLVIDKWARVGDNWRSRYQSLKLHSSTGANHLPFLPFPDFYPEYIPKDKVGSWFEFYADALELNVWTSTTFTGGEYDAGAHRWIARMQRDGAERVLHPRHIVMATGVSGTPNIPEIPGLDQFGGTVMHSSAYADGDELRNCRVLVVGSGTSAHDVAEDLCLRGAQVTMMQRSKTAVISRDPAYAKMNALYNSGIPINEADLIRMSSTYPMQKRWMPVLSAQMAELDKDMLDGLNAAGFETHLGEDGMGVGYEYFRRGGGYYIDIGCSGLIASGKVKILQARDAATFTKTGLTLGDGSAVEFDVVILATGYKGIPDTVARLFGPPTADRVGKVWGLDAEGEFNNVARRTAQEGLWFMAGGFPETRIFSRYLALQIQADDAGIAL